MLKKIKIILCIVVAISLSFPAYTHARMGDCGYEGGISSGESPGKTLLDYQEICFVSGEPVILKGTLTVKKALRQDTIVTTYTYNLKNSDRSASLSRVMVLNTKISKKENGQSIEETSLARVPSETVKIKNQTYVLKNYDFSRTNIIDSKPAVNYFAGNTWGRKTYQTGTGTAAGSGKVTVEETGEFYGYDQYWGTTEAQVISYIVQSEQKKGEKTDVWGGTASVKLSSTMTKKIDFFDNIPDQISFKGGYVQKQHNEGILEYSCKLPEFDKTGAATDNILNPKGSLKLESFPVQTRLLVPDIKHLKGHWAEKQIGLLYSLEVFSGNGKLFRPEQYISRAEFAAAISAAAKEVPPDPALASKTSRKTASSGKSNQKIESPFDDVSVENAFFNQIDSVYKRGIMEGTGGNSFSPNGNITLADAVTVLVRALGLENLAPNPEPVTLFKDNDKIPKYARKAVYVAEKIGLIQADSRGYINPSQKLTKARASVLLADFIKYMQDGIRKDYRERIVNY